MKILVCGSRKWTNKKVITDYLSQFGDENILVHGAARGADSIAAEYAAKHNWETHAHPAQWKKYGYSAGPIRNAEMLAIEKPDLVIAFRCKGRSTGTDHMMAIAKKADVVVVKVNEDGSEEVL
jgi:hypothetical protein